MAKFMSGPACSLCTDGVWFQFGDVMVTAGANSERQMFYLPAPGVTSECLDNSPAGTTGG